MKQEQNHTDPLSQLMQNAKLQIPFSDFEETVMHRIQEEKKRAQAGMGDRKISFVFFVLGSLFGLVINFLLQRIPVSFFNLPVDTIALVFQSGFVILFLIYLEKNLPLIRQWKKQLLRR